MIKNEGGFDYLEVGEGRPIILLHGLMGSIENFGDMVNFISKEYKIYGLDLQLFKTPLLKSSVKNLALYLHKFMQHLKLEKAILLGNSMGGHVGLIFSKLYPEMVDGLILTGSSGLYENSLGNTFPRRGDYQYIKEKTEEVFFDPKTATKELVDSVFEMANTTESVIRLVAFAKSAIRHNMAKDLEKFKMPCLLIWGKYDKVTPPDVAKEFHELLANSELYWIDKCGHAPMMEHPEEFNRILSPWLKKTI